MPIHFLDGESLSNDGLRDTILQRPCFTSMVIYGLRQPQIDFLYSSSEASNTFETLESSKKLISDTIYLIKKDNSFKYNGEVLTIENVDSHKGEDMANSKIEQLETILRYYPNGSISLFDENLNFLVTAGSGYAKYGIDPKTYIGKHASEILMPEVYAPLQEAITTMDVNSTLEFEVFYQGDFYRNTVKSIISTSESPLYILRSIDESENRRKEIDLREVRHAIDILSRSQMK